MIPMVARGIHNGCTTPKIRLNQNNCTIYAHFESGSKSTPVSDKCA